MYEYGVMVALLKLSQVDSKRDYYPSMKSTYIRGFCGRMSFEGR
jgi:hypothetical protein